MNTRQFEMILNRIQLIRFAIGAIRAADLVPGYTPAYTEAAYTLRRDLRRLEQTINKVIWC